MVITLPPSTLETPMPRAGLPLNRMALAGVPCSLWIPRRCRRAGGSARTPARSRRFSRTSRDEKYPVGAMRSSSGPRLPTRSCDHVLGGRGSRFRPGDPQGSHAGAVHLQVDDLLLDAGDFHVGHARNEKELTAQKVTVVLQFPEGIALPVRAKYTPKTSP